MPLTEHLWTWDRFLSGGQDFEAGTLAVLMALCLVLVFASYQKQCVHLDCRIGLELSFIFSGRILSGTQLSVTIPGSPGQPVPSPAPWMYNSPIQI